MDALGDLSGPEVEAIKKAFKKAQEVARERPVAELVKECKSFIERFSPRVNKLKAELVSETGLLEEGRVRLARLTAQQATPVAEPVAGCSPASTTLQQMVNQLQLERDSLSQELRRSRASKGRPWCGAGHPDVSAIPPVPDHLQGLEEWLNLRNCELQNALEFGSPDVVARLSHLVSQGASQFVSLRQGIGAQEAGAMEVHPSTPMSVLIDAADAKRRCLRWWALMSSGTWRIVTRYGMRGQRIGEAKNPSPGSQRRRTQRLRALQRALDSESDAESAQGWSLPGVETAHSCEHPVAQPPESLLDVLEFDLTRQDSEVDKTAIDSDVDVASTASDQVRFPRQNRFSPLAEMDDDPLSEQANGVVLPRRRSLVLTSSGEPVLQSPPPVPPPVCEEDREFGTIRSRQPVQPCGRACNFRCHGRRKSGHCVRPTTPVHVCRIQKFRCGVVGGGVRSEQL